ncbi:HTH-type transcriptional regulator YjdC [mine drainage metagenome]|uniref:HTH-type transcriptional regulator YjdC n=1 Tax=mine drainage metagenome TaxID=410659 RepID=A0A1J5QNE0_9ZZZZ
MATQMREHILGVAAELFSSRGINATSVDTIVAEAGIAKVTLYKYFKSKEQLILEYLRQYDEKLWQKLSLRTTAQGAEPKESVLTLVNAVLEWIADPEFKGFAFVKASVEFPQLENPVHRTSVEFAQTLRNTIAGVATEAGIRNAETLALQLSMVIEGAAITENMQRESGAVQHAKELAKILIDSAR